MSFEAVLKFWFGQWQNNLPESERQQMWFTNDESVDLQVKRNFTFALLAGSKGELDAWEITPQGRLAFILLLDQFPRNIFRGTANAFLYDEKALSLARDGVEFQHDKMLRPIERMFMYMPYQHSESLRIQKESVTLCESLLKECKNDEEYKVCKNNFEFAKMRHQVIERFGRFPHRNKVLGRLTTVEEENYLVRGGQKFGQ